MNEQTETPAEEAVIIPWAERPNFQHSPTVGNRSDLARLCNAKGLTRAVEVGTDRGMYARAFLDKWDGEILYCVDTYASYIEMPWDRSGDMLQAIVHLADEARRVRFVRAASKEVAGYFGIVDGWPKDIDFVYIDGAHDYKSIQADIENWWSIVRLGGILAGDDYHESQPDVMRAVFEFAQRLELRVDLTTDYNRPSSWYIEKY